MTTFAVTSVDDVLTAVNFAISNLNAIPVNLNTNVLQVNTNTNAVTVGVGGEVFAYNVQYINIRYANNAVGTNDFSTSPTNRYFYGIQATADAVPATLDNPASYSWQQVAGNGFGTTNFLFYQTPGGRQITFDINTAAQNSSFIQVVDGQYIDLDLISTIAANVITGNTIANGAITGSQIAANTITSFNIQNSTIVNGDIAPNTITGGRIAANTIVNTNIAPQAITADKIANATITNQQIAANTILGTNIQAATITGSRIAANTILGTNIQAATITGSRIAINTISGTNIGLETITGNNIANGTIMGQELASNIAISTTGNVSAAFLAGDGSQISNINAGNIVGAYGNANVATFMANFGSNTIVTTGNISAGFYSGNGSQLTGIVSSYGNANVATFMANFGSNNIVTTGNIDASTVQVDQVITLPTAFANLTAVSGGRAFVNNANLAAANNFGQQISGGGSNTVPVWSDGTNWYIG
jgi:hypothetical protein